MDDYPEVDLQRFDLVRRILRSRASGSNEYTQSQMLTAIEACKEEYARIFVEFRHEMNDTMRVQLEAELASLNEMMDAERASSSSFSLSSFAIATRLFAERGRGQRSSSPSSSASSSSPRASNHPSLDVVSPANSGSDVAGGNNIPMAVENELDFADAELVSSDVESLLIDYEDMDSDELEDLLDFHPSEDDDEADDDDENEHPLHPEPLNVRLIQRQLTTNDVAEDGTLICPISWEDLVIGQTVSAFTPCGHFFSLANLARWMEGHRTCPTCRANIVDAWAIVDD